MRWLAEHLWLPLLAGGVLVTYGVWLADRLM